MWFQDSWQLKEKVSSPSTCCTSPDIYWVLTLISIKLFFLKEWISGDWEEEQRKLCASLEQFWNFVVRQESLRNLLSRFLGPVLWDSLHWSRAAGICVVTSLPSSSASDPWTTLWFVPRVLPEVPGGKAWSCCQKEFSICFRTLKLIWIVFNF